MKNTGLFYSADTVKTASVAKKIADAFGSEIKVVDAGTAQTADFEAFDNLIVGTSTWFDGELPGYWDETLPGFAGADMKGKKVAIFGLGDQAGYPENFVDGVGILADAFEAAGATIVGYTEPQGYEFSGSLALKDGKFRGLVLDLENQPDKTDERLNNWIEQLKREFEDDPVQEQS